MVSKGLSCCPALWEPRGGAPAAPTGLDQAVLAAPSLQPPEGPEPEGPAKFPCIPDPQKQEAITTHCVKLLHAGIVCHRAVNNERTQSATCPRQCNWAFVSATVFACDASRTLTFPPSSSPSCRVQRRPPLLSESLPTPSGPPPCSPRAGPGSSAACTLLTGPACSTR